MWISLLTLTFLEIVLGVDNIIFISIVSSKLREEAQEKARKLGLTLAMFFRIGLLLTITWIIKLTKPLFTTRCAGSFVEEKRNTLTWHYRNTNADLGFIRSRELLNSLQQLTVNTSLQIIDGNKVLEIRMTGIDKGITATKLINKFRPDFVLCMGDDTTDEDMFRTLERLAVTIKVGNSASSARYNILTQEEVVPFLQQFVKTIRAEHPPRVFS